MKKITLFLAILFLAVPLIAQDYDNYEEEDDFKTIFHRSNGDFYISGFGGPMMAFTNIGGDFAHMMGGGGGVIINNFFFGGYGMGLTTNITYKNTIVSDDISLDYGHGGFWTGYVIGAKMPVHLAISGQFGWGGISQGPSINRPGDSDPFITEPIFVVTPIAELEFNFSHFFKVGIGGSMSFVSGQGITQTSYTRNDFLNPAVFLSFKFGYFQ